MTPAAQMRLNGVALFDNVGVGGVLSETGG